VVHRGSNPGVAVRFQRYSSLARLHSQKPPSTMDYSDSSSSPIIVVVVNTRRDGGGGSAIVLVEEKRRCSSFALEALLLSKKCGKNATICRQPKTILLFSFILS
jgi:hypothetical protein